MIDRLSFNKVKFLLTESRETIDVIRIKRWILIDVFAFRRAYFGGFFARKSLLGRILDSRRIPGAGGAPTLARAATNIATDSVAPARTTLPGICASFALHLRTNNPVIAPCLDSLERQALVLGLTDGHAHGNPIKPRVALSGIAARPGTNGTSTQSPLFKGFAVQSVLTLPLRTELSQLLFRWGCPCRPPHIAPPCPGATAPHGAACARRVAPACTRRIAPACTSAPHGATCARRVGATGPACTPTARTGGAPGTCGACLAPGARLSGSSGCSAGARGGPRGAAGARRVTGYTGAARGAGGATIAGGASGAARTAEAAAGSADTALAGLVTRAIGGAGAGDVVEGRRDHELAGGKEAEDRETHGTLHEREPGRARRLRHDRSQG
jgi:hypothetical protein